jgi:hypothetical protein
MNLILSDVEETILIVDTDMPQDMAPVNVCYLSASVDTTKTPSGRKTKDGHAVRQGRRRHFGKLYLLDPLYS